MWSAPTRALTRSLRALWLTDAVYIGPDAILRRLVDGAKLRTVGYLRRCAWRRAHRSGSVDRILRRVQAKARSRPRGLD